MQNKTEHDARHACRSESRQALTNKRERNVPPSDWLPPLVVRNHLLTSFADLIERKQMVRRGAATKLWTNHIAIKYYIASDRSVSRSDRQTSERRRCNMILYGNMITP